MKKKLDDQFKKELEEVKAGLPVRYFAILEFLYPGKYTKSKVYNVMNAGVQDRDILKALKRVARLNTKNAA